MSNKSLHPLNYPTLEAFQDAAAAAAREQAAAIWNASEKERKLAGLHAEYGFASTKALIAALEEVAGTAKPAKAPKPAKAEGARRTRTTITDAIRSKVKELHAAGKKAPTIAKEVGISTPTVYKLIA